MPNLPVEDPREEASLVDRSLSYVRASPLLRIALVATAVDHAAAVALALARRIPVEVAGVFILLSVVAWFFAVCVPVMNRAVRVRVGTEEGGYWTRVAETFGRVALAVQTLLYTAIVAYGTAFGAS